MLSNKYRFYTKKSIVLIKCFCLHLNFILKNTLKEALRFLFNLVILFSTFFLNLDFKLKIDLKACNFKNLDKILKT